jgi:glycosyltransferase involved in cell wall biosynthesis
MITVVIPLYNGIEYLEEAIRSVQSQVYTSWVCIIGVNGHGETGGTVLEQANSIVASLNDARFSVIHLPEVRGAPEAINALVARSTTPWIAHLDADDRWHPMKLHCQMNALQINPIIDIIGSFCSYFGTHKGSPSIPGGFIPPEVFRIMNPVVHSSVLIKKELAHYTNEFITYDYDCWIRNLLQNKIFYNVPLEVTYHRLHPTSHFNASGQQKPELVRLKYLGHM